MKLSLKMTLITININKAVAIEKARDEEDIRFLALHDLSIIKKELAEAKN